VYIYQVVNTATTKPVIEHLQVPSSDDATASYSSGGYLTNSAATPSKVVFENATGQVKGKTGGGTGTNTGLGGATPVSGVVAGDNTPSRNFDSVKTISGLSAARSPVSTNLSTGGSGDGVVDFAFGSNSIAVGGTSTLVFLTSKYAPTSFPVGHVVDGTQVSGDIPGAITPEPTSMAMIGVGMLGAGFVYGLRRRRKALPTSAGNG
jgi:hypothetical protein